jgi:hypothetical protein
MKSGTLMVKFVDDLGVYAQAGRLFHDDGSPVREVNDLIDEGLVLSARPELAYGRPVLRRWRSDGEERARTRLADLSAYFRLTLPADVSIAAAGRLADRINLAKIVELAFLEGRPEVAADMAPATPNYEPQQDYLGPAPAGVNAYAAWTFPGGKGEGVTICDIENGWHTEHEDLSKLAGNLIGGDPGPDDHGTAVMGEMLADSALSALTGVGYGVTGISYGASGKMVSVVYRSTAEALMLAAENLSAGDIILIELHQPGPNSYSGGGQYGYVPMEWTPSIFDVIQTITANGIIVCEAAGNGSQNLDDPIYGNWFDTTLQHSGAIMCGAGAPPNGVHGPDRSRLDFSNYGMRVDLQGYGRDVVTTGYGGLFDPGDENQWYTATFSGTSSASPIVTASVACIQGRFKYLSGGYTMTAREIRDLLDATGSAQTGTTSEHIGPRPDLGAAMLLVQPLSAYAAPRTFNVSLLDEPQQLDTLWLINPHGSAAQFNITVVDSLPVAPAPAPSAAADQTKAAMLAAPPTPAVMQTGWLGVSPVTGSVPANDSLPVEVAFDGGLLSGSYFGTYYKGRLDIELAGAAGIDTLPVPVMAMAQDSLHGDTIDVVTATVTHRASSETNFAGWDYNDQTTSGWLYDGSFLVGRRVNGDTVVYRDVFGNAQMWRGRDFWAVDSSWWPRYLVWRDSSMTEDSLIGLSYELWVPTSGDSAEFVLWRTALYSRGLAMNGVTLGLVADWDLPASSGANNLGAFDTTRQLVYQTGNAGYESNVAGFALLGASAHGAVVGSNPDAVYPNGGFIDSELWSQMHQPGFRVDASNEDLHTILTAFEGQVTSASPVRREIVVLSSRNGVWGIGAPHARAQRLSDSLRYLTCPIVKTGDVNVDNVLTSADIISVVNYVFKGGDPPQPIELAGDVNCDASVNSSDIILLVNHVFKGGPVPCDACTLY